MSKREPKTLNLPSGKVATICDGTGRDVIAATKLAGVDTEKFLPALMAQLVLIDGQKQVMEDFYDLPSADYMKLMGEMSGFM